MRPYVEFTSPADGSEMKTIDLRSDTVTMPSEEMRLEIGRAEVGDDGYGEDPSVNRLEAYAAELLGKQAALFVPSGTMANLLAHLSHCPSGADVIGPDCAHTFHFETGGLSRIAGMTIRTVPQKHGELCVEGYHEAIRQASLVEPGTGLLWVEEPTRGFVVPLEHLRELHLIANENSLPIHIDGARLFNAAIYLGVTAKDIAQYSDTVMFCLSKGLAAPAGSLLLGDRDFIGRARRYRRMLGGGMRQAGFLAAAGLFALRHNVQRLVEDHDNARHLAKGLRDIPGIQIDRDEIQTNMFYLSVDGGPDLVAHFARSLAEHGVLVNHDIHSIRLVTHYGIEARDITRTVEICQNVAETIRF